MKGLIQPRKKPKKPWLHKYSLLYDMNFLRKEFPKYVDKQLAPFSAVGAYIQMHQLGFRFIQNGFQVLLPGLGVFVWWPKNSKCGVQSPNKRMDFDICDPLEVLIDAHREIQRRKRRAEMSKEEGRFDPIEIEECTVERESDKAILVKVCDTTCWIPKSQISDDSEVYKMDSEGTLIIPQWLAEEKGLV